MHRELLSGTIVGNLVVPAGETCTLSNVTVTGNVSVQGTLYTWHHVTIDRNVNVNGGVFNQVNYPVIIRGNLSITGSAGENGYNGFFAPYAYGDINQSQVYGNFSYTGNSAALYVGYPGLQVHGNFSHSLNTSAPYIEPALTVDGNSNISYHRHADIHDSTIRGPAEASALDACPVSSESVRVRLSRAERATARPR